MKSELETIDLLYDFIVYLNNIYNDKKSQKIFRNMIMLRNIENKKFIRFYKDNGINKLYSPLYNSENNGLAEKRFKSNHCFLY